MIPKHVVKAAIKTAKKATSRVRIGAVVYYKNHIMARAHNNTTKTHPLSNSPENKCHAEFLAVLKSQRDYTIGALRGASIYVHRLKLDDTSGLAAPCIHCQDVLASVGIEKIGYSM